MKRIIWKGTSLEDLNRFPKKAKQEAGFELYNVQLGHDPSNWKPMPTIGSGVKEIRIKQQGEYRVIYVAKFHESVYVLHAFVKKTQKTTKKDIDIAKARYQEILREVKKNE